jgi:diaminopimelate epimerase
MACGTGACAAGAVTFKKGLTGAGVRVLLEAGELLIENSPGGKVFMTGPAEYVCEGETV